MFCFKFIVFAKDLVLSLLLSCHWFVSLLFVNIVCIYTLLYLCLTVTSYHAFLLVFSCFCAFYIYYGFLALDCFMTFDHRLMLPTSVLTHAKNIGFDS